MVRKGKHVEVKDAVVVVLGSRLRGGEHVSRVDPETGFPKHLTLCGLGYEVKNRTGIKPIEKRSEKTCQVCVTKYWKMRGVSLRGRGSKPDDLKIHFTTKVKPVCNQDCHGEVTDDFKKVTCEKCYDWFDRQGET
jgi:hypothetical protein